MKYSFEKLEVWHDARELTKMVYKITRGFPDDEKFGLTNQMRRAVISVLLILSKVRTGLPAKTNQIS